MKHINAYLYRQYSGTSLTLENQISVLNDSLYVLGVRMALGDVTDSTVFKTMLSAWDRGDGGTQTRQQQEGAEMTRHA